MTDEATDVAHSPEVKLGPKNRTLAIFLVSVLGLFLEMLLIRWIGTEIRIFAYLQNTVLVVCFLGLGMGCFTCRKPIIIRNMLIPLLVLTAILAIPLTHKGVGHISELLSVLGDLVIWHHAISESPAQTVWNVTLGLGLTFVLMLLLWEIFVPLGRLLGRMMDDHPRTIWAYSVNVAGSLIGIWLFVALSAFYMPPVIWFMIAGAMLLFFLGRDSQRLGNVAILAVTIVLAWFAGQESDSLQVAWSPYQKLVLRQVDDQDRAWPGKYLISVNNTGYQGMIDLSEKAVRANPNIKPEVYGLSQYDIPIRLQPQAEHVLIVGAGSGNDAAGALRGGAKKVTAVEIDPAIIAMGRRLHPESPYEAANVTVVNDDARSFFATTNERFDLITFGLLDSHTMTAMTNARLDHYVYTRESLERAKSLLTDRGIMVLSFEAEKPFVTDRMQRCVRETFGFDPIVFRIPSTSSGWGGVVFVTGNEEVVRQRLAGDPTLAGQIAKWQAERPIEIAGVAQVASDDWPYIYLDHPKIPTLYFLLAGLMVTLVIYCTRRLATPGLLTGWKMSHWHFFFLGAAFLLLEVQNISKASVILGNTWWVNAVIISGILLMILFANYVAAKFPKLPAAPVYLGLIGSCLALYFIDIAQFASLPFATKAAVVGTLTTLPMFFSGIVFIRSFAIAEGKHIALGANLIGGLVGALLQSITFVIGIKALLLVVAGLYIAALMTRPRAVKPTQPLTDWNEANSSPEERSGRASAGLEAVPRITVQQLSRSASSR